MELVFAHLRRQERDVAGSALGSVVPICPVADRERWIRLDGGVGTAFYRFSGDLDEVSFLRYDVTNLAYNPRSGDRAVIGVGGGRDLLSARLFGVSDVIGIEISPIYLAAQGALFRRYRHCPATGIAFEVDEARSWFARTDRSFDIIQMV